MKRDQPEHLGSILKYAEKSRGKTSDFTYTPYKNESGPGRAILLVSCEHGGHRIPARYRALFSGRQALLHSHRGYDAGALQLAQALARALAAPLLFSTVSRLLIDLNRSPHHPRLYSEATRALPPTQRRAIFERYYQPYRNTLRHWIADAVDGGQRVVHLSCHSFTPELGGRVRNADLGLLYDPARASEAALCRRWQALLGMRMPGLAVRRNYPYQGKADSFTTELRRHFADDQYCGIEIEINQSRLAGARTWTALRQAIIDTLRATLVEA